MKEIMIVDDQAMVREGLAMILSLHEEIKIVGEAAGQELLLLLTEKTAGSDSYGHPNAGDEWDRYAKNCETNLSIYKSHYPDYL